MLPWQSSEGKQTECVVKEILVVFPPEDCHGSGSGRSPGEG